MSDLVTITKSDAIYFAEELARSGHCLSAVKLYRSATGASLKDSMNAMDAVAWREKATAYGATTVVSDPFIKLRQKVDILETALEIMNNRLTSLEDLK